jgi:hypothetical protein
MHIPKAVIALALLLVGVLSWKLFERQPEIKLIHYVKAADSGPAPASVLPPPAPESRNSTTEDFSSGLLPESAIAAQVRQYCDSSWLAKEILEFHVVAADLYRSCGDSNSPAAVAACHTLYVKSLRFGEADYQDLALKAIGEKCYPENSIEACKVGTKIEREAGDYQSASYYADLACLKGDTYSCDAAVALLSRSDYSQEDMFFVVVNGCLARRSVSENDGVIEYQSGFEYCGLISDGRFTPDRWKALQSEKDRNGDPVIPPPTQALSK